MALPIEIILWRDNLIKKEWRIDIPELVKKFRASTWYHYEWPLERSLMAFITAPEKEQGLQSSFEGKTWQQDFDAIRKELRAIEREEQIRVT